MPELRRCTRCVMPETWVEITFDEEGVCNICRNYEKKQVINWDERKEILIGILDNFKKQAREKGNKYDCLVGYSGGKDTVYTLWAMKKKYGMRPLALTFDHGFKFTEDGEYNIQEIPKILDVDHIRFSIGNGLRNGLCKKGSEVMGDFCWHCHNGVGAFPARISKALDIPLQVWGEPTGEYQTTGTEYTFDTLEEQNESHFKKAFQCGITPDMVLPENYEMLDLMPFQWPDGISLKAIYLGNFEPWEQRKHVEIIENKLGWRPYPFEDYDDELIKTWGNYVNWDKVDCPYETIRNWQKFIRRGFDKFSFQASKDIRDGIMERHHAIELLKYEGLRPFNMNEFCKETNITEAEFYRITKRL